MTPERRKSILRRDLNDLVRDPSGRVSEAKTYAAVFKGAMVYVFLKHTELILKDWMVLAVFVTAMIAPDVLKKILSMRAGASVEEKK